MTDTQARPWYRSFGRFLIDFAQFCVYDEDHEEMRDWAVGAIMLGLLTAVITIYVAVNHETWADEERARAEARLEEIQVLHSTASAWVRRPLPESAAGVRVNGCRAPLKNPQRGEPREIGRVTISNTRPDRVDIVILNQRGVARDFLSVPAGGFVHITPELLGWRYELRSPEGIQIGLIDPDCPTL